MQTAVYFCTGDINEAEFRHYALNVSHYTHFTSPIRRYADIVVHRLLAAALEVSSADTPMPHGTVTDIAKQCNERKLASRRAQEASSEVYLALFIQEKPLHAVGIVTDIDLKGKQFGVYVPEISTHDRIHIRPENGRSEFHALRGKDKGKFEVHVWWNTPDIKPKKNKGKKKGKDTNNANESNEESQPEESTSEDTKPPPNLILRPFSLVRVLVTMADTRPLSVTFSLIPGATQPSRDEVAQFEELEVPPVDK
jgi:hypothetical protein